MTSELADEEAMAKRKALADLIQARMAKPATAIEQKRWKEFLLLMPEAGEDADFERNPDCGRDVEL